MAVAIRQVLVSIGNRLQPIALLLLCLGAMFHSPESLAACPATFAAQPGQHIQLISCTEARSTTDVQTATVGVPASTQLGDFLIAVVATDGNENFNAVTGWVLMGAVSEGSQDLAVYTRVSDGAEPASYNFTWGSNEQYYAFMMRFTGASGQTITATNTGSSNAPQTPSVTTQSINNLILRLGGYDDDDINIDPVTIMASHFNITQDSSGTGTASTSASAAYNYVATQPTGTGTANFSLTATEGWSTRTIALDPIQFRFTMPDTTASVCGSQPVTVSVTDRLGNPMTWFRGTVTLTASNSTAAVWTNPGGVGNLTDTGNGGATFEFVAGNNGVAVLQYHNPNTATVNFGLTYGNWVEHPSFDPTLTVDGTCRFRIVHDLGAGTCGPEEITFQVVDSGGALATHYTGTINISLNVPDGSNGTFTLNTGTPANFTAGGADSGTASYDFDAGEGEIILDYLNTNAETVNFNVADAGNPGYLVEAGFDPNLVIGACALRFTHGGSSSTCSIATIELSVVGPTGTPVTSFSGIVQLSVDANDGTWSNIDGVGGFVSGINGTASYDFDAADGGNVELGFLLTIAGTVNFQATSPGITSPVAPFDADLVIDECTPSVTAGCPATFTPLVGQLVQLLSCTENRSTTDVSTATISVPAGTQLGDFLITAIATDGNETFNAVTGWVFMGSTSDGSSELAVYTRVSDGAEPGSYNFTWGSNEQYYGYMMRYSGASGLTITDTNTGSSATPQAPLVNTLSAQNLILRLGGYDDDDIVTNPATIMTNHINITQEPSGTGTASTSGSGAYRYLSSAGSTGTGDFSLTATEGWNTRTIALDPIQFRFSMPDGVASNCGAQTVTLSVTDRLGNPMTWFRGTVTLSASNSSGAVWSNPNAIGNLTDNGNGAASFEFVAGNAGVVTLLYHNPNAASVNFGLTYGNFKENASFDPTLTVDNQCRFRIIHDGNAGTCSVELITISVHDSAGVLATHYAGLINVSLNVPDGSNGDFTLNTGTALNFSAGAADSGTATYDFDLGENLIILNYANTNTETVNFNIADVGNPTYLVDGGFDPDLVIGDCRLRFTHSGSSDVCSIATVTVSIVDPGNGLVPYVGTVTLSLNTGSGGTWSTVSATNAAVPTGPGTATYLFDVLDGGTVNLGYTRATSGTVNFQATGAGLTSPVPPDDADLVIANCTVEVDVDPTANVCSSVGEPVTLTVRNSLGAVAVDFDGIIVVNASTGNGNFVSATGGNGGLLNDIGSGIATYDFHPDEDGTIILNYVSNFIETLEITASSTYISFNSGLSTNDLEMLGCEFRISHSGQSDICSIEVVTIDVYNSADQKVTNYVGTVNLTTSTGNGGWVKNTGDGDVVDPNSQDGSATYNFQATDLGTVVLDFTHDTTTIGVNINVTDSVTSDPGNPTDPDDLSIEILACTLRITLADGSMTACESENVTFTVYDSGGIQASNFAGLMTISTSTFNGNWTNVDGLGMLSDTPLDDNGSATYEFLETDGGDVVLNFTNLHFENVNIGASAGQVLEDGAFDPGSVLQVTGCLPSQTAFVCENVGQSADLTIPTPSNGGRMVVMFVFHVGTEDVSTSPTFAGQSMTFIHKAQNPAGAGTSVELWGIQDANLPGTSGPHTGSYAFDVQPANDPSMCMVALDNVNQTFPAYNAGTPSAGRVNGSISTAPVNGNMPTSVTSQFNNAVILSAGVSDYTGNPSWFNAVDPNPPMSLLLGAGNNDANPENGTAGGSYGIKPINGIISVTDIDNQTPVNGWAHLVASFGPIVPGLPVVDGFVPVLLFETLSGNISYQIIGKSLRPRSNSSTVPDTNGECTFNASGSADLSLPGLPDAIIRAAYLYWVASGIEADIDDQVFLDPPGATPAQGITALETFMVEGIGLNSNLDYFVGYQDVKDKITGNGTYTFSGLTIQNGTPWITTGACAGGWALVVVYEHPNERLRVANLFHGFQPFQNSSFTLVPRNFRMATSDGQFLPNGQVSHITVEGDEAIDNGDESLGIQDNINSETFNLLENAYNPQPGAEFNSTVTRPAYYLDGITNFYEWNATGGAGGFGYDIFNAAPLPKGDVREIGDSWGFDIDTHFLTGATASDLLYNFAQPGSEAEQITTRYSAGGDLVMLIFEAISVTNYPIADLELFKTQSDSGSWKVNTTGSYFFEVKNNGNGALSGGFADGEVIVGDILPTGLALGSVTGDGWNCSLATVNAFSCIFDIATDWTVLRGAAVAGQLAKDESLPLITVDINVGGAAFFPLVSNNVKNVGRMISTGGNCGVLTAGVIPLESDCDRNPQFDNKVDLQGGALDINDLTDKGINNNNVDSVITTIRGVRTDLGITKVLNGILEVGETGSYTITVTNYGPDATTAAISVTDPQPPGITFDLAAGTGWVCNLGPLNCTYAGSLAVSQSAVITLDVTVTGAAGQNVTNTATVATGQFNFDQNAGNNSGSSVTTIVAPPVSSAEKFLLSVSVPGNSTQIGGLAAFENHDYFVYDPLIDVGSMFFDNSVLGFGVDDADAVHLFKNGHIGISAAGSSTVGSNVLAFEPEDIVVYDPIIGTAVMLFDGSAVFTGPITGNHNIDAIYVRDNGRIVLSTEGPATIGATSFQRGDLVEYNPGNGTATIILDASDPDVFGSEVQVDGLYIRVDPNDPSATIDVFVLSVGDSFATIGACGDSGCDPQAGTTLTWDDIVEYNATGFDSGGDPQADLVTQNVFVGDIPLGVFTPADDDRLIDAIHVVEDGYMGHFAISQSQAGNTCAAGQITISKHRGLTHALQTTYQGSIRLSTSTNQGDWSIAAGTGTLDNGAADDGIAVYTFGPTDFGTATFYLAETTPSTINVNVTNGITRELASEDPNFSFSNLVTAVSYRDEFSSVSFANNDGSSLWDGAWVEGDDDIVGAASGNVSISGGLARFTTLPAKPTASLSRVADLSLYTISQAVMLSFDYSYQSLNAGTDVFVVEARPSDAASFTQVWSFALGGTNGSLQSVSLNLTTLLSSPVFTDTTEVRFRITSGYTGTSLMRIDNVQLSTATNDCGIGTIDHYEISIDGMTGNSATIINGVQCVGSIVTITGHDANHFPALPDEMITLQTSTNKGSWSSLLAGTGALVDGNLTDGTATYDFPPSELLVSFRFNYTNPVTDPENVNFNLNSAFGVHVSEDPTLAVSQAGLRFFDETNTTDVNPLTTQIAGKPSNALPLNRILTIEAVRTSDDDPQACLPLFDPGNTLTIGFAAECLDPGTCSSGPAPDARINGDLISLVNSNSGSDAAGYTNLDLLMTTQPNSGNPGAQLVFQYNDSGLMQLHARFAIPLNNNPQGTTVGDFLRGSSNTFVVRPFGFDIDFSGDRESNGISGASYAADANGSVFATAGLPFDTTVSAVVWEAGDDLNNDGSPDSGATLSNNAVTRNYGNETTAAQYDVRVSLNQVAAPLNGVGALTDSLFNVFSNGQQIKTMTFSEVGIIDLDAQLVDALDGTTPFTFMGTDILIGNVRNVGRFIPAEFLLSGGMIASRSLAAMQSACLAPSNYTYMGEEFGVSAMVTAMNGAVSPQITRNYVGDFAKLNSADFGLNKFSALEVLAGPDTNLSARLGLATVGAVPGVTWNADPQTDGGEGVLSGNLIFGRQGSLEEDGPFSGLTIALATTDSDAVGFELDLDSDDAGGEDLKILSTEDFRYGRMLLDNGFGPETEPMNIPFRIEYWDGSEFLLNTDDSCTVLFYEIDTPPAALDFVAGSYTGNLEDGDTLLEDGVVADVEVSLFEGQTAFQASGANQEMDQPFFTSAPGDGNDGGVIIEFDLDHPSLPYSLDFLSYDWRTPGDLEVETEDADYSDNPRSRLEFGSYRGHDRVINWQEIFLGN